LRGELKAHSIDSINQAHHVQVAAALSIYGLTRVEKGVYFQVEELPGWYLKWTGWKAPVDDMREERCFFAQWIAYRRDSDDGFYVAIPGGEGVVVKGGNFDIARKEGQSVLLEEDLKQFSIEDGMNKSMGLMTEGLGRLLRMLKKGEL
jgi:hypothetical protein